MIFIQSPQQLLQRVLDSDPARFAEPRCESSLDRDELVHDGGKLSAFLRGTEPRKVVKFVADSGLEG